MRRPLPLTLAWATLAAASSLMPSADLPAQAPPLVLPKQSPRASVSQTVGLTEITITYDRPAVNGRQVWGELVPFDTVWRAGANENTVIAFSSPVRIGGQTLAAVRYGMHMIPSRGDWTIILSQQANAWGSFSYEPQEDALRVTTAPVSDEMHERLAYTFNDPTEGSVVATLRWEKLAVPFTIEVDSKAVVADMNTYGYLLMEERKVDSAIMVFRKNTRDCPKSWNTYDSLAEAYAPRGDKKLAAENYSKALRMVQDPTQKQRLQGALAQRH